MKNAEYVLEQGISFEDLLTREMQGGRTWEIYVHKSVTDECPPFTTITTKKTVILGYTKKRQGVTTGTKAILQWLGEEHHVELLSDAEREELRRLMNGWRYRVMWIQKHSFDEDNDYISVGIEFPNGTGRVFDFMPFESDAKYRGLQLGVKYVPEELLL